MGLRRFVLSLGLLFGFVSIVCAEGLFSITPASIQKGRSLKFSEVVYLDGPAGDSILSGSVSKPAPGKFYLRRKLDARNYAWFEGQIADNAFEALYVFSLKDKNLSVEEMMSTKVFGVRDAKPFQDEQDVYFDRDNLYTSRVPTLYFRQNGQWQTLVSQPDKPGILRIESKPTADIVVNERVVATTPMRKGPAQPGFWTYALQSRQALPLAWYSLVRGGHTTIEEITLPLLDSNYRLSTAAPVTTPDSIQAQTDLRVLENWYDLADSLLSLPLPIDSARLQTFESTYPRMRKAPPSLGDTAPAYRQYADLYAKIRAAAREQWLFGTDTNKILQDAILERLHVLEAADLRVLAPILSAKFVKTDSTGKNGELQLQMRSDDGRLETVWRGLWHHDVIPGDTLAAHLLDTIVPAQIYLTVGAKPVWITHNGSRPSRHLYRFTAAELAIGDVVTPLSGVFELPPNVAAQAEVKAWLDSRRPPKADTVPVVKAPVVVPGQPLDTAALYTAWLAELLRGKVAEIPGGKFRYKNKVVEMSPYAIQLTETTQLHWSRIRTKNPSKFTDPMKPVHNITWYDAKQFCEEIGGNLPTEAQWEFAARAGSNKARLWEIAGGKADDYAVFAEISEDAGKKSSLYGPQPVAQRKPNAFGLYDVHGNVTEWMRDNSSWFSFLVEPRDPTGAYFGHFKIIKGGDWKTDREDLNLSATDDEDPRYWGTSIGVRCIFPSHQKIDTAKVREFFTKRQVTLPPFYPSVEQNVNAVKPATSPAKADSSSKTPAVETPAKTHAAAPAPSAATSATQPAKPSTEPAKPTAEPAKLSAEPAKATAEPVKPSAEPAKPTTEPAKPSAEPAKPTAESVKK